MSRMLRVAIMLLALAPCRGAEIETATALNKPEDLGFSSERLDHIDRFYEDSVRRGEISGMVLLIARHGKLAHFSAIGYADLARRTPMRKDTVFRLYSMTKPIAATALMLLYEEGRFQL